MHSEAWKMCQGMCQLDWMGCWCSRKLSNLFFVPHIIYLNMWNGQTDKLQENWQMHLLIISHNQHVSFSITTRHDIDITSCQGGKCFNRASSYWNGSTRFPDMFICWLQVLSPSTLPQLYWCPLDEWPVQDTWKSSPCENDCGSALFGYRAWTASHLRLLCSGFGDIDTWCFSLSGECTHLLS